MNVPLSWLKEYVELPKSEKELTDKLTMVGQMLDKRLVIEGETVLDLELRGNRSDLFGIIGVARDIAACFNKKLTLPPVSQLPKVDPKSKLVSVEAPDLVERFLAFTLKVKVGPSPEWIVRRLKLYGIAPINNVVDITNYVMLETAEPMHAYDLNKLAGKRLILRRAKKNEPITTLLGAKLTFSPEDLVIADQKRIQGTAIIGSLDSGVTDQTQEILLEAAVYNQANVRRTSRRLAIRTEAGSRHEKLLDPNQVSWALSRALYLLQKHAGGAVTSLASDYYPNIRKPNHIEVRLNDITSLTGISVDAKVAQIVLEHLGCEVKIKNEHLLVSAPTFRTDIVESADIVEEIARIYGYEKIPSRPLSGELPEPATSPRVTYEDRVRDILTNLHTNEVITSPMIQNDLVPLFEQNGTFGQTVKLVNPPDPTQAILRPSLLPNLVDYAKRSLGFRQERVAFFEIGKVYLRHPDPFGKTQDRFASGSRMPKRVRHDTPTENSTLGIIVGGQIDTRSWSRQPRPLAIFDLKGILEGLLSSLGIGYKVTQSSRHPSLDPNVQGSLESSNGEFLASFGQLHPAIQQALGIDQPLFAAKLSLEALMVAPATNPQPYTIAPAYPPLIEDLSFEVPTDIKVGDLIQAFKKVDARITNVSLLDAYQLNRTIRITYANKQKTLTSDDVKPIREKLITLAQEKFGSVLKT